MIYLQEETSRPKWHQKKRKKLISRIQQINHSKSYWNKAVCVFPSKLIITEKRLQQKETKKEDDDDDDDEHGGDSSNSNLN